MMMTARWPRELNMTTTKFLTLQEAADELRVSIDTIRRAYRATGDERLPVVRIGQVVRIRRVDWDRWVERHLEKTA
jgi:excisionase family DNA binding protein